MSEPTDARYSTHSDRPDTWPPAGPQATLAEKMLLDEREAAAVLGIGARTLAEKRYAGEIPAVSLAGRRVLYDRRDLLAWIDRSKSLHARKPKKVDGAP